MAISLLNVTFQLLTLNICIMEKIRYEWIDNAKVLAIFLILTHHLLAICPFGGTFGNLYLYELIQGGPLTSRNSFFFAVSGYFLSRNISWGKAFQRSYSLLMPLFLWNSIIAIITRQFSLEAAWLFPNLLGVNGLVNRHLFCIFGQDCPLYPLIGPSWFLRDLAVLALLTPIFCKLKDYIPLFATALCFLTMTNVRPDAAALLSPATVVAYSIGCYLSEYSIPTISSFFTRKITYLLIVCTLLSFAVITLKALNLIQIQGFMITAFGSLISIVLIANCGILIERHLPKASKHLSSFSPAFFLVFILHMPLINYLHLIMPEYLWKSWWVLLLVPVPVSASIMLLYYFIVRFTPALAPYLCNTKTRRKSKSVY